MLFEEEPLVCCQFAWNEFCGYKACNHCLRPLETAQENARRLTGRSDLILPFPQCCETVKEKIVNCEDCGVLYCSNECRMKAFHQYHQNMCLHTKERNITHPLEKLVEAWKELHYPPETSNIMLLVRVLMVIQQSSNKEETLAKFTNFCHRMVNEEADLAHKLIGKQFIGQIDLLLSILKQSVHSNGVEQWLTPEGFRSLLALIGTNGQGVATSAISVWVKNSDDLNLPEKEKEQLDKFIDQLYDDLDKKSGTFLDNEGSALYALQSTCNHSCNPNVKAHFKNNNFILSMLATRDIKAGEEVLVSYLDDCTLARSRHTRQKILMENYLFKCNCSKCISEADEPDITSEEEMNDSD